ncbi:MAG TPA: hypothetical protein VGT98_13950 [Candidatus Elarobacter sp.]|nr:hypothetical protein [Candidatus Elarobacter sp.]HEV2738279.1 hypothetical protein [Candidatus Elarobacter sp.]
MITKRLSLIAIAAAFAVSGSAAMLQSSRPALADADDHHPRVQRHHDGDHDRDDRRHQRPGYHWANGQWIPNNVVNHNNGHWVNGQWVSNNWNGNPGKHKKHKKDHDRDHDRR